MSTALRTVPTAEAGSGRWRDMVWVTWRLHRAGLVALAVAVFAAAAVILSTGLRTWSAYERVVASNPNLMNGFSARTNGLTILAWAVHLVPAFVGMFVGAPLIAREFESDTYHFAWTQGAGRVREVTAKLVLLGGAVAAAGVLVGGLSTWWARPFESLGFTSQWLPGQFEGTASNLAAWSLLAFAIGAFAGAALKRTVAAMAATVASTGALTVLTYWKLDNLLVNLFPLVRRSVPAGAYFQGSINTFAGGGTEVAAPRGSWVIRAWYADRAGHPLSNGAATRLTYRFNDAFGSAYKPRLASLDLHLRNQAAVSSWLFHHHVAYWISLQPVSRFWIFQGVVTAVLVLLAVVLGGTTLWLVRRAS